MTNDKTNYNLQKISEIDNLLILNMEDKEAFIKKCNERYKLSKIVKILSNKTILVILVIINTFINKDNMTKAILSTLFILIVYNSLVALIIHICKIPKSYCYKIDEFNKIRELLLIKRNLYVNLYNYSKNKEKLILNNIKLRINNKYFLDYSKYKNQNWLKDDLYAYTTLKEMQYKEMVYTDIIRNRIELELMSPNYNEEIPKEELKEILDIL